MATAAGGFGRGGDAPSERRQVAVSQGDQEVGPRERFGSQSGYTARFGDEFEGAEERREGQDVWRADMEGGGAGGRFVVAGHRETAFRGNSPPPSQPGRETEMAAVQVKTARRPRP